MHEEGRLGGLVSERMCRQVCLHTHHCGVCLALVRPAEDVQLPGLEARLALVDVHAAQVDVDPARPPEREKYERVKVISLTVERVLARQFSSWWDGPYHIPVLLHECKCYGSGLLTRMFSRPVRPSARRLSRYLNCPPLSPSFPLSISVDSSERENGSGAKLHGGGGVSNSQRYRSERENDESIRISSSTIQA